MRHLWSGLNQERNQALLINMWLGFDVGDNTGGIVIMDYLHILMMDCFSFYLLQMLLTDGLLRCYSHSDGTHSLQSIHC